MISPLRNLFLFVSLVIITYALFVFWPQIADFAKLSAGQAINTYVFQRGSSQYFWQAERFLWSYYAHIRLVDFYPAGLISAMELIFLTPAIRYSINLGPYPVYFAAEAVAYVSNGIRILLASIFCMSFIFQPALKRPLSLVWLRIVESDKPILTLVLGGGVASLSVVRVFETTGWAK
jgi:hypothetical protein